MRGCTWRPQLPPVVVVTCVVHVGSPVGFAVMVTVSPACLLDTVPESVIASPKIMTEREVAIETARVFCATATLPANGLPVWLLPLTVGSVYVNVPGVANVHEPLCEGCRVSLQFVLPTATA